MKALLAGLGLLLACACAGPARAALEPAVLVVASDLDNAPFAFVDGAGRPAGRDVEMMELLAERADFELEWRRMPFEALLGAVELGQVDLVCATIGVTPERAQRVAFSQPYFETTQAVLVRAGAGQPRWLSELRGRRVAAARDTTSGRAASMRLADCELVLENESGFDPAARLRAGEVDAVVLDRPSADDHVARSAGALRVLAEQLAVERYALVLPLERIELRERLDAALESLQAELARLDLRYGLGTPGAAAAAASPRRR